MLFNALEGLVWLMAAGVTWVRTPSRNAQERLAVWLGTVSFVLFGVSDWLECQFDGRLPWWLWSLKIGCGIGLVAARYTWLGWHRFRLWNREVLFGLACLLAVALVIWLQGELEPGHPEDGTTNLTKGLESG